MSEYIPSRIRHRVAVPSRLSNADIKRAIAYGFSSGQLSLKPSAGHAIETVLRNKSKTKLG